MYTTFCLFFHTRRSEGSPGVVVRFEFAGAAAADRESLYAESVGQVLQAGGGEPRVEQNVDSQRGDDSGAVLVPAAVRSPARSCRFDRPAEHGSRVLPGNGSSPRQREQTVVRAERTFESAAQALRGGEVPKVQEKVLLTPVADVRSRARRERRAPAYELEDAFSARGEGRARK